MKQVVKQNGWKETRRKLPYYIPSPGAESLITIYRLPALHQLQFNKGITILNDGQKKTFSCFRKQGDDVCMLVAKLNHAHNVGGQRLLFVEARRYTYLFLYVRATPVNCQSPICRSSRRNKEKDVNPCHPASIQRRMNT